MGRIRGREGRLIKGSTLAMDRSRIETHVKPLIGKKPSGLSMSCISRTCRQRSPWARRPRQLAAKEHANAAAWPPGATAVAARTLRMGSTILEHAVKDQAPLTIRPGVPGKLLGRGRAKKTEHETTSGCSGRNSREAAIRGESETGLAAIRFILLSGFRRNEALGLERSWLLDHGVSLPDSKSGPQVRPIWQSCALAIENFRPLRAKASGYFQPTAANIIS